MVVLANGAHILLRDLVERLFARTGSWLVYTRLYLPNVRKPLYVVAYQSPGFDKPLILLSDMVAVTLKGSGTFFCLDTTIPTEKPGTPAHPSLLNTGHHY